MRNANLSVVLALFAAVAAAQVVVPAPDAPPQHGITPLFRVTVVAHDVTAVNYHVLHGKTSVDLVGTPLLPSSIGHATVEVKDGATHVRVDFDHVLPPERFGNEYLSYVLWAVTPDGRATNLGEVQLQGINSTSATIEAATPLQDFALFVTAEPYFLVSQPSNVVVMENAVKPDTFGAQSTVIARTELLDRADYRLAIDPTEITALALDPKVPLDLYEAENAVRIARWAGAEKYAPEPLTDAAALLQQAEGDQTGKAGKDAVATDARSAIEKAEDARLLTVKRRQDEAMQAAKDSAAAANAAAQASAQQTADALVARQAAESDSAAAQAQAMQAQQEAANAAKQAADAETARASAETAKADADAARASADAAREASVHDAEAARTRLRDALNSVMATRDSATGLIVNMPDTLFAVNEYQLTPPAQIALAKMAGILLTFPDLKLQVNGYTDNTGTDDYNMTLSQHRADSVRDFLVHQGVTTGSVQATGFGKDNPVSDNTSTSGRQQNRRVEVKITGNAIGNGPGQ